MAKSKIGLLIAALIVLVLGAGFSACPSGYYPDPDDSNCKIGKPYSVSVNSRNLGEGKFEFEIVLASTAKSAVVGISSSSEYVVPVFYYSDGSKVQLGDYTREGTTSSVRLGECSSYILKPGESISFTTVTYFKPNQEGREITASADNINWLVLPSHPACTIGAQGRETKAGERKFVFTYASGAPKQCSGKGGSCDGNVCCQGLYCSDSGVCLETEKQGASTAGTQGSGAENGAPTGNSGSSGGISNAMILGILLGVVALGVFGYFFIFKGRASGSEINHAHSKHHKKG